jgi:hypothetical protein
VLGSLVRNLTTVPLTGFVENLLYPALILAALTVLGHLTGLIGPAG